MLTAEQIEFYIDEPLAFIEDFTNYELDPQQKDIINCIPKAIKEGKGISIKAGHGVGKTFIEANIIIWYITTHPNCRILCTATTQHQIMTILWTELFKVWSEHKLKDMFEWLKTKFSFKGLEDSWFAVARTSSKPEALQGFHAEHLLVIVDEASGIEEDVFEVLEGTQTEEGSLIMMFGNPTQDNGGFFDSFHTKRKFYYNFTLSCLNSPRVKQNYGEKIASKFGIDSDVYRVRVLGQFPIKGVDSLISLSLAEAAAVREVKPSGNIIEIGCDVARFGSDETTIYYRIGNVIEEHAIIQGQDTMKTTGDIVTLRNKYPTYEAIINIDDTGVGGGVTDRLRELVREDKLDAKINPVNNGSRARKPNKYKNRVTEMYFNFKDWLKVGKIPNDNDLIGQLSVRKYHQLSNAQLMIESKKEMKKRKISSPDKADGVVLTINSLTSFEVLTNLKEEKPVLLETTKANVKNFTSLGIKDRMRFYKK